jgi:two-component system sensor histidine kinase KdpD
MTDIVERSGSDVTVHSVARVALILLSLALGLAAHILGNPVTAALLFLFGVVLLAAQAGVRHGLVAGIGASLAYNFLSAPALRLSFSSLDDLVPLLAFNISAVASAYVAGRLRDEARSSEEARGRVAALLKFSGDLQHTVDLVSMMNAAQSATPSLDGLEVRLDDGEVFRLNPQDCSGVDEIGSQPSSDQKPKSGCVRPTRLVTEHFDGGTVTCKAEEDVSTDVSAYLPILAIAAERWVLTERLVEADVCRRSEAFKTSLISSMSHDLRTPLSIISASAGSLLSLGDQLPTSDKRDLLRLIEQQSTRLNRFTSKLLSLGRIEGGLAASTMPETDALEVLGAAIVNVRQLAPTRNIRKVVTLEHAMVRADPSLLEQVIYNVLENAVVHTPGDTPILVSVDAKSEKLVIGVEDRGPGVSRADTELVFERFRKSASGSGQEKGLGLGLSISRGFARAIDGDVAIVPTAEGARFEISLPLVAAGEPS